jgi:hypothetical protein
VSLREIKNGSLTIFARINGGFAADQILWGEPFFFCAEAQKKNGSPQRIF